MHPGARPDVCLDVEYRLYVISHESQPQVVINSSLQKNQSDKFLYFSGGTLVVKKDNVVKLQFSAA